MFAPLGYSVYLTGFEDQKPALEACAGTGAPVFLSLHISEEFSPDYSARAEAACRWLGERGFRVIADVSVKTMVQFGERDLSRLARRLGLWALRIDYGLRAEEVRALAERLPVVLNASTVTEAEAAEIAGAGEPVMAMHNFYPRPETGLDDALLEGTTRRLQALGLKVLAFLPGDGPLRGPVHAGLPTLERHREVLPSAAFAELMLRFGLDGAFVGDPGLSVTERERIGRFCAEGVLSIPAQLSPAHRDLYGRVMTNRVDAPSWLIRVKESREYSCFGAAVPPEACQQRSRGSVTLDNDRYARYSGELQLIRSDLPADGRVNVIGRVPEKALPLLDCVQNGGRFVLVEP